MTVLVTGGRGFLAGHLASELHRRLPKAKLVTLDRLPQKGQLRCDLVDLEQTRRTILKVKPTQIYHLAGTTRPLDSAELWQAHVSATGNLMKAALILPAGKRPKIIVLGSSAEYGKPDHLLVSEKHSCRPLNPYGSSKRSQTLTALSFRNEGLDVVVARPFNVIGPGIPENLALGAFARQLVSIKKGRQKPRLEVGDLSARRDFVDARDMARALVDLGLRGRPGEIYNISSGKAVAVKDLLQRLIKISGLMVSIQRQRTRLRPHEVKAIAGSHAKLTALTGWKPRLSLEQTLRDVWQACLQEP